MTHFILQVIIGICIISLVIFIFKEIWRNKDSEWKEIFKKDSKKNLNDLLGITKTTFLALITGLILASVAFLTLIETGNQNHRSGDYEYIKKPLMMKFR